MCIICDDDEVFSQGYERSGSRRLTAVFCRKRISSYSIWRKDLDKWGDSIKKLGYRDIMSVSSWQITFRREKLLAKGIRFDENMGAGSGNGAEEEFRFLTQCRKAEN